LLFHVILKSPVQREEWEFMQGSGFGNRGKLYLREKLGFSHVTRNITTPNHLLL